MDATSTPMCHKTLFFSGERERGEMGFPHSSKEESKCKKVAVSDKQEGETTNLSLWQHILRELQSPCLSFFFLLIYCFFFSFGLLFIQNWELTFGLCSPFSCILNYVCI
ncbi:hypothetical protein IHE45_15G070500 [Dioscorea alata]|uniref:Uncharacterized protein n=1 Tax=Dioscorea alata TaxID=55571 RepID=A0ACB7UM58_DIOAL|nr:hypothetical protein IHE45_15G070500 [Dioscorea alata]